MGKGIACLCTAPEKPVQPSMKPPSCGVHRAQVQMLALAFPACVILDESFLFSEPLFLYPQNGDNNITWGELNEI